ncbi:preprotein translocase subunit SecE [Spirochaeta cellobiosiphila]|uniref:preprotein translocase subunit SecE n=1 Tax=Spirochaeta cellobiosiphila TaxID=504483 RepID=UPI000423A443|nr:preprotein translocase subunit SecE [Spirochaeta cellobiosiphila]
MKKIKAFIEESINEMKKVVWPGKESVMSSIRVVFVSTVLFAIFFGVVDYLLMNGLYLIF